MNIIDRTIFFDWNGTLLADTSACLTAMNRVLGHLAVPATTLKDFRHHYRMPIAEFYRALGCPEHLLVENEAAVRAHWHEAYDRAPIRLRRGAKQTLTALHAHRLKLVVLSNYLTQRIEAQAARFGVRRFFDKILAFEMTSGDFRRKGKIERVIAYAAGRPFGTAMIIGDTEEEVEIGRHLGLVTVAITDGACSTARLRAMKPDFLIRGLGEVPAVAARVFGAPAEVAA